jgi:hypothetical protein
LEGYDLVIVDGPFGSDHYSRSQSIEIAKNNLSKRFCIFLDDSEREGEKETINTICKILTDNGTQYFTKEYTGEKNNHSIICSDDLRFLTSLS